MATGEAAGSQPRGPPLPLSSPEKPSFGFKNDWIGPSPLGRRGRWEAALASPPRPPALPRAPPAAESSPPGRPRGGRGGGSARGGGGVVVAAAQGDTRKLFIFASRWESSCCCSSPRPRRMPFQQGSARTRQRTVLLVGMVVLLAALILAVVLASVLTHGKQEVSPRMMKWKDRGTTKNLQEVILGRCYSYVMARYPELGWVARPVLHQVCRVNRRELPLTSTQLCPLVLQWQRDIRRVRPLFCSKMHKFRQQLSVPRWWLFRETTCSDSISSTNLRSKHNHKWILQLP